jgi:hypothetical protein
MSRLIALRASVLAGYAKNDGNAVRLKGNEKVRAGIEEILAVGAEKAGGDRRPCSRADSRYAAARNGT